MNQRDIFLATRFPARGPAYPMRFSKDRFGEPAEGGSVRFAWDEEGLYVFAEMEDSFMVAKNPQDDQLHYRYGDVLELFIKPLNAPYKWELYVTPNGNKSTLFFPSWPTELTPEEGLTRHSFRKVKVDVRKRARGWTAEFSVPVDQLTALGAGWGDGTEWIVFCGRYNYSSDDLTDPEYSMAPALSKTDYHLIDEYALLKMSC